MSTATGDVAAPNPDGKPLTPPNRWRLRIPFLRKFRPRVITFSGTVDKFESLESPIRAFVFGMEVAAFQVNLDKPLSIGGTELRSVPVRFESGGRLPNIENWHVEIAGVHDKFECVVFGNTLTAKSMAFRTSAYRRVNPLFSVFILVLLVLGSLTLLNKAMDVDIRQYTPQVAGVAEWLSNSARRSCEKTSYVAPEKVPPGTLPRPGVVTSADGTVETIDQNVRDMEELARAKTAANMAACIERARRDQMEDAYSVALAVFVAVLVLALIVGIILSVIGIWLLRVAGISVIREYLSWIRRLTEYRR